MRLSKLLLQKGRRELIGIKRMLGRPLREERGSQSMKTTSTVSKERNSTFDPNTWKMPCVAPFSSQIDWQQQYNMFPAFRLEGPITTGSQDGFPEHQPPTRQAVPLRSVRRQRCRELSCSCNPQSGNNEKRIRPRADAPGGAPDCRKRSRWVMWEGTEVQSQHVK